MADSPEAVIQRYFETLLSNSFKSFPDLRVDWRIESLDPVPGEQAAEFHPL